MFSLDLLWGEIPDVLEMISKGLDRPPIQLFKSFEHLSSPEGRSILPRLYKTLEFFSLIQTKGLEVAESLSDLGMTRELINQYPEGVKYCILEVLNFNKPTARTSFDLKLLTLLGRDDLIQMVTPLPSRAYFNSSVRDTTRDMKAIIAGLADVDHLIAWDGQTESDRIQVSKLIFSSDRRFYEASKLLQSSRSQVLTLIPSSDWSETELLKKQEELYYLSVLRVCAISFGRAALYFSARRPLITEKYPIPRLNFTAQLKPSNVTLSLQKNTIPEESLSWGYFHNGVSSGLSVSKEVSYLNGSWITFNKPATLTSQHAGLLLGLGLNGHLRNIEEWHIYNYLGPKHTHTSIALLIGMAASNLGSMNTKITRVLSVHIVALLPAGSSDLNISTLVQTAGIIAMGLLYASSQHRRMTETFLGEIEGRHNGMPDAIRNEGYKLASGIALGLINLGKGHELHGLIDIMVVERLLSLATKSRDVQTSTILDVSVPGAVMALLLMFLKTSNLDIAKKLAPPTTTQFYDYIRPDFLLIRTLACHLILWDSIGEDEAWVIENIPKVLPRFEENQKLSSDHLPYFYVVAGLCMAMGLRHASTGNIVARDTLLYYLDRITKFGDFSVTTHDKRITKVALLQIQSSISLSLSITMAGTGDLETLRRVREMALPKKKDTVYGTFVSAQMCLGILFLGGGQYGFDRALIDIAALVISLYPIFPTSVSDNFAHLQPLRYFWALAAKPRCLVVREADSGDAHEVEVDVTLKSGATIRRKAPFLLPEISETLAISVASNLFFPLTLRLDQNTPATQLFMKTKILLVSKRILDPRTQLAAAHQKSLEVKSDSFYHHLQLLRSLDTQEITQISVSGEF